MQGYNTLWMPGTDHAGIATQIKVEEELRRHFKGARIARLDQDVTKHKDMGEEILQDFGKHKNSFAGSVGIHSKATPHPGKRLTHTV